MVVLSFQELPCVESLCSYPQKVYASPSRRRMDTKGEVEEITYPSVCFHVDNFDEVGKPLWHEALL